ncbi:hypothetical protein FNF28_01566 [Cafeteria roenbergensis]|uniref:Uncharacterized protein n=1 Tax=Cafeteria roenbergensis TaxID=33653 RepID=A0A5A8DYS8_CAFRO|nr:hypothetical protein FNF28_01566 [Cafeteria roenbergensis]
MKISAVLRQRSASPRAAGLGAFAADRLGVPVVSCASELPASYRSAKDAEQVRAKLSPADAGMLYSGGRLVLQIHDEELRRADASRSLLPQLRDDELATTRTRLTLFDQGPGAGVAGSSGAAAWLQAASQTTGGGGDGAVSAEHLPSLDLSWDDPALAVRLSDRMGRASALARAVGLRDGRQLRVLDCTGGLGRDALWLAAMGCGVRVLERSPTVAGLLACSSRLAAAQPVLGDPSILDRLSVRQAPAEAVLSTMFGRRGGPVADVVLLDPMFPPSRKSSAPSKHAQVLRAIAGEGSDQDTAALLRAALGPNLARRSRVVLKVPNAHSSAALPGIPAPDFAVPARMFRFDVWLPRA